MPSDVASRARARPRVATAAAALAAGVLSAFSLPPWGWWPLGIAGLAVFAVALHGQSVGARALAGGAFGLGTFSIGLWWITEFHAVGYVLLIALELSFFVAAGALARGLVAFPAAIVLGEAARGAIPFGGLPLGGLALGQAAGPLVGAARIGGALLVLAATASLGAAVAGLVRRQPLPAVALTFAAIIAALAGWSAPAGEADAREIDAVLVQGGGPRGFRAIESDALRVFDAHVAASENIESPVDLVLWPENAIDVGEIDQSFEGDTLAALARDLDTTVIAGVTQDRGNGGFDNTAFAWSPDGEIVDEYTKVRRVPFGEYVPMRNLIEGLVDLGALPRDAVAGAGSGRLETPAGTFAVTISYEVFFADRARSGVRDGGIVLLVPTNAASFSTSQVPTQEVAAAQLRAWETGRWVLQAAPTGYSAVIDHRGRVLERSVLSRAELLTAKVEARRGTTAYVAVGDWPLLGLALVLVAIAVARGSRT